MRDTRAQSPPRNAVITLDKILERPPQAPLRRHRPLRETRDVSILPADLLLDPWVASMEDDRDDDDDKVTIVPPSWRIAPRRLFVDQIPDISDASIEMISSSSAEESQSSRSSSDEDLSFSGLETVDRRNPFSRRGGGHSQPRG